MEKFCKLVFKWRDLIMAVAMIFVLIVSYLTGCSDLNETIGLDDDHIFEEFAEEVIRANVGIDVDLSPSSEE
jgi:hypothetical protein